MLRGVVASCAVVAALATGCGSTVQQQTAPRVGAPSGSPNTTTGLSAVPGPSEPAPGTASSQPADVFAPIARQGSQPVVPGALVKPGGTVTLGFFISDDASQIYKTLGISGASHTREESRAIWQAVLDQVNARGGIASRKTVASYFWIDSESGTNATRAQAACEQFTRDDKVFAVVLDGAGDRSLAACLAQRGVPAIDVGQTSYPYDDVDLRRLAPHLYLPGRLSMGRFATYVDRLAAHGFFAKDSKVGLLRFDLPNQERTRRDVIEPALKRHGLRLLTDVAFTPVEGTGDLPRASTEAQSAVLQMQRAGVDRVLFLGSGLSLPFVFPTVANSQGYRPRYGITTDDGPDFMASNAPAEQMTGAMAVGWEPQYDVPDSDAVLRGDALWQSCAAVMRRAGFTPRDGRRCTAVYFLERALAGAPDLTAASLRAGADRIGAGPYSTQTYDTFFRPGRYDGVSAVRVLRFTASCTCFRYLTGDLAVS